jgi:hypothetical protein
MRLQPAEPADRPTRAAQVRALTDEEIVGEKPPDERVGAVKPHAVLDRALQLPCSLRLGFLLRELNRQTKGNA